MPHTGNVFENCNILFRNIANVNFNIKISKCFCRHLGLSFKNIYHADILQMYKNCIFFYYIKLLLLF